MCGVPHPTRAASRFPLVNTTVRLQAIISGVTLLLTGKGVGELGVLQRLELSEGKRHPMEFTDYGL